MAARLGRGGWRRGRWTAQRARLRRHTAVPADVHNRQRHPNGGNAHSRSNPFHRRLAASAASRSRAWGAHSLLVGTEGRYVEGTSIDTPFAQGQPLPTVEVGGTQRLGSAFVQDTWRPSDSLTIALGAHGDIWHSESAQTGFAKSSGSFNPRASASYRIGESGIIVRGAVYHGFRAPTLNELYRNISVGNTQTRPNEALEPERLTGGDVGVMVTRGRVSARVTGFWNVLDEAITAITLSSTPQLIIKQRANADTVHASGLEVEASMRLSASLSATFASGFVSSTFQGHTSLHGNRVPQVPEYNVGLGVRYTPLSLEHVGAAAHHRPAVRG